MREDSKYQGSSKILIHLGLPGNVIHINRNALTSQNTGSKRPSAVIKVRLSPSKRNCFICFNESPLKMVKNDFYFILKALFVLKIFKFLSCLFGHAKSSLIRNIKLISKFITSQAG